MNVTARTTPRIDRTASKLAALLLLALALIAPAAAAPNRPPDLGECSNLEVVDGKVVSHVYAEGVQIYRWNGTSWGFVAPEALLFANANFTGGVGIHYEGPTWESRSGSKVGAMVLDRCFPDPTAIPWLLLQTTTNAGPGIYHRVTLIQRVNTVGGNAPAQSGDFPGQEVGVPYTAEYFFYRSH